MTAQIPEQLSYMYETRGKCVSCLVRHEQLQYFADSKAFNEKNNFFSKQK